MSSNSREWREAIGRRSERRGRWGREAEAQVATLLHRIKENGLIRGFIYHQPNSEADSSGMDFTVFKDVAGQVVERSFGITISVRCLNRHRVIHRGAGPDQFCFPINMSPEKKVKRILSLFCP